MPPSGRAGGPPTTGAAGGPTGRGGGRPLLEVHEDEIRERRIELGLVPAFKRIDTCAAEFESFTPYLYSTYERECEAAPTGRPKVVILGSGPNRIGQGVEFG